MTERAPLSALGRTYRLFILGLAWGTGLLLVVVTVLVLIAAAVRYLGLFPGSLHWVSEMTRISIIWLVMLGAALAHDQAAHVAIEIPDRVPEGIRRAMRLCGALLGGAFLIVLTVSGVNLAMRTMGQLTPALHLPVGLAYLALPVGAALMLVQSVLFVCVPGLRGSQDPVAHAAGSGP